MVSKFHLKNGFKFIKKKNTILDFKKNDSLFFFFKGYLIKRVNENPNFKI